MPDQRLFAMEVTLNGLMAGVLYALVALGFVLICKASGIYNHAQEVKAPMSFRAPGGDRCLFGGVA